MNKSSERGNFMVEGNYRRTGPNSNPSLTRRPMSGTLQEVKERCKRDNFSIKGIKKV